MVGSGVDLTDDSCRENAFVSRPGTRDFLPPLAPGGIDQNRANDINSFGTIVGSSTEMDDNCSGPNARCSGGASSQHQTSLPATT